VKVHFRFSLALLGVTLLFGCASPCRHFSFHEVSAGIWIGCRPKSQDDFAKLRQCGIRTIISYETFTWHVAPEKQKAARYGFGFRNVPIFASPFGPSEEHVREALILLSDKSLRPVYAHCLYGRDRTLMIIALYRVYFEGASPEEAWLEMKAQGAKLDWQLWGFRRYFWEHTSKPLWVTSNQE
jgi:hypothetical protein